MSEQTSRGNLQAALDPSNPSVNKQTMLDWLRINHPKTVISSKANKGEVANIVREKQPHIFRTPTSVTPDVASSSTNAYPTLENLQVSSPKTRVSFNISASAENSLAPLDQKVSCPKNGLGMGDMDVEPILIKHKAKEGGRVGDGPKPTKLTKIPSRPKTPKIASGMSDSCSAVGNLPVPSSIFSKSSKRTESDHLVKRLAPDEFEDSYPHKHLGLAQEDSKPIRVKAKDREAGKSVAGRKTAKTTSTSSRSRSSNMKPTQPAKPVVPDWLHTLSHPSPQVSSVSSVSNEDDKMELEALKESLSIVPSIAQETNPGDILVDTSTEPFRPLKPSFSAGTINSKNPKESVQIADDTDLIQFSDTEVFEVGNLVFGKDIPTINLDNHRSPSKKKSGVDVFQEEQQRERRVQTLEERLANLEASLEAAEKKASGTIFQDLQEKQATGDAIDRHSSLLEDAQRDIRILELKVRNLDVDSTDLQHDLELAHAHLCAHRRVLRKILGPNSHIKLEEEYDSHSDSEPDPVQPTPPSCTNDSPASE